MTDKAFEQQLKEDFKRKDWTREQWLNSDDPIDRLIYVIADYSPHNMWKGREAIRQLIQTEKQAVALDIINAWEHHETPSGLLTEHVGTWGVKIEKLKTKYVLPKENNEK